MESSSTENPIPHPSELSLAGLQTKSPEIAAAVDGKTWIEQELKLLEQHHPETVVHSFRVVQIAEELGKSARLSPDDLSVLLRASLLHDIGKRDVPVSLLDKEGRPTPDEEQLLSQHPRAAFEKLKILDYDVARVIVGHHESQLNAYSRKEQQPFEGEEKRETVEPRIVLLQQILALSDQTDALMSKRSYKEAFTKEEAQASLPHFLKEWVKIATRARESLDRKDVGLL